MKRVPAPDPALVVVVCGLAAALIALLSHEMSPDGWYALLGGDVVVHHGLPSHDWLTVWGYGRRWVDQQWLAQLFLYGLYALGGLRLALLFNALLVVASFAGAVAAGRARVGSASAVFWVALPGAVAFGLSAYALRPQTLVLPLYVALVWLLVSDSRLTSNRVFLVVPVLVIWANLHGSVTLGVLLVVVAVACSAWRSRRLAWRDGALAASAIVALFASPYAPHLAGYYRAILFNGEFAKYVPDWMPTSLGATTVAFYILALGSLYAVGRAPGALTLFERVVLLLLLLLAVQANRGIPWFALAAIAIVPPALRSVRLPTVVVASRTGVAVSLGVVVVVATVVLSRSQRSFEAGYPSAAAVSTREAAGTEARVFANGAYADWLLLVEPSLRGRVAYDARFEVLPDGRLADAAAVSIGRWDARRILAPFDVVVLRPEESELRAALARAGGWQRVPTAGDVVVLRRVPS
jgi:hypothetical protein